MSQSWIRIALIALAMGGNLFLYGAAPAAPAATSRNDTQNQATEEANDTQNASLLASASVAKNYVDALDRGEYAQSWSGSDPIFQKTISQEEWKNYLERSRKQLGKVLSRKMKHQGQAWNPKGLPEGAYMVITYDTSFQNLPNIEELITMRQGPDQKWRVLTYELKQ